MTLRQHASILPMGSALIACAVAAQEAQHNPVDGSEFRIYGIYLAGPPGKPLFIKASVEYIESVNGANIVSKHWVEEWIRDQEGRVWGRVREAQEAYPGKLPPLAFVWLFDVTARNSTVCSIPDRNCQVHDYDPSFFKGNSTYGIDAVSLVPERVQCGGGRFEQNFLGERSIGGISLGHILTMCYKLDGSHAGVDLWHNSEFDVDFNVINVPPRKGARYYHIDQISSSVPDDPKLFQVPPSGYSSQQE